MNVLQKQNIYIFFVFLINTIYNTCRSESSIVACFTSTSDHKIENGPVWSEIYLFVKTKSCDNFFPDEEEEELQYECILYGHSKHQSRLLRSDILVNMQQNIEYFSFYIQDSRFMFRILRSWFILHFLSLIFLNYKSWLQLHIMLTL